MHVDDYNIRKVTAEAAALPRPLRKSAFNGTKYTLPQFAIITIHILVARDKERERARDDPRAADVKSQTAINPAARPHLIARKQYTNCVYIECGGI